MEDLPSNYPSEISITVNQRLARALTDAFTARRLAEGVLCWETPDIFPLSSWLQRTWEAYTHGLGPDGPAGGAFADIETDDSTDEVAIPGGVREPGARRRVLLGPFQEHALWDRIIRETAEPEELLQAGQAAQHAMVAWARIKGWRVSDREYQETLDDDAEMFSRWAHAFVRLCREQAWIDPGSALDELIAAIRGAKIAVPQRVTFVGFDELTPQQRDLLAALEGRGALCRVRDALSAPGPEAVSPGEVFGPALGKAQTRPAGEPDPSLAGEPDPGGGVRVALANEEKELEAAARWARALVEDGVPGPIGIVIPELTRMRPAVLRVFDDILRPEAKWSRAPVSPRPFDISLGEPLAEVPLVRDALLALGLADGGRRPVSAFSHFLLSPYFVGIGAEADAIAGAGGESELMARARFDVWLRAAGEPWLTFDTFSHYLAAWSEDSQSGALPEKDPARNDEEQNDGEWNGWDRNDRNWDDPEDDPEYIELEWLLASEEAEEIGTHGAGRAARRAGPARAGGACGAGASGEPILARRHRGVPRFRTGLLRGISVLGEAPDSQAPSDWARTFARWLGELGWPGERSPDSEEYQAIAAFYELLGEFAGLNPVLGGCSFPVALSWLGQVADGRIFQPKSAPAPVQILGIREAAGLSFSHLWVLGLHADAWPPPPRPNPFLPIRLQRRAGMPQVDPEIELARARRATARLLASAGQAVVSYPKTGADLPKAPSPLITWLPEADLPMLAQSNPPAPGIDPGMNDGIGHGNREPLMDEQGPPLESHGPVGKKRKGGTRIWQDQARCPFRAFAVHRLGATGLDVPTVGLDYALRGVMVHEALEAIWRELRDSKRLTAMDDDTLGSKIAIAVNRTLVAAARQRPETLRGRLREIERTRLEALLGEWLALEKERPPFTVIAPERGRAVSLVDLLPPDRGDLPCAVLSLRPDRMDRIEASGEKGRGPGGNGPKESEPGASEQYLLFDYKTGNGAMGDWFGERPTSPQLPLYAVVENSDGIGFAFVRRGEMRFEGIAALPDLAPGIETPDKTRIKAAKEFPGWYGLRDTWHRTLVSLAESFARGDARVDPKSPESCRYCDLHSFCRVREEESSRCEVRNRE
ncbi:MAG: probable DNA repair protein [Candidatus Kentron sp. G]|nr:MAG: probable DNA repair protein [Candidatus Kentron sp. G]VFN02052.1 MAG: probable DNA repair protein [Candidatus Kentron sp. G]